MKIAPQGRQSFPSGGSALAEAPKRGVAGALVGLIVVAVILIAAFVVVVPRLPDLLKGLGGTETSNSSNTTSSIGQVSTTTTSSATQGSTTTTSSSNVGCNNPVGPSNLVAPDISNGKANVWYPPDYCVIANYALGLVNADRATNSSATVSLGTSPAAQQHADSMLYYNYFSHFDTQGYKPYMRYSFLGGLGADFENVAFVEITGYYTNTTRVEHAVKDLEFQMMYNDSKCCGNGHRDNILNPLHNLVSIGVAYTTNVVYFDEEFENNYINLNFSPTTCTTSGGCNVVLKGVPTKPSVTGQVNSIYIFYDPPPTPETAAQLNCPPGQDCPYGPGTATGGVLPKDVLGQCGQFTQGITVCADKWVFTSSQVDVEFSLDSFIQSYHAGIYTIYMITGSYTTSAITTVSVTVT